MTRATVVRAPWAQQGDAGVKAIADARLMSRLDDTFARVHATEDDVMWSLAGTHSGCLIGFPGSGRYRDKPTYDPTRRPWFIAAAGAETDEVVWGNPYPDASTRRTLISCVAPIRAHGRDVGVVGLEVTLDSVKQLLTDFAVGTASNKRCILLKGFEEEVAGGGSRQIVYRAIVDTDAATVTEDWRGQVAMPDVRDLGEPIAGYFQEVVKKQGLESAVRRKGGMIIAHSNLNRERLYLLATK